MPRTLFIENQAERIKSQPDTIIMTNQDFKKIIIEANKIVKKYPQVNNIIFDNWRGWRFIFDTEEVRRCHNDCQNCGLYKFLKGRRRSANYAGLIKASKNDKAMFGRENFLNCKSWENYQNCYTYFILNKTKTAAEIKSELDLLMGLRVVYSANGLPELLEDRFKKEVIGAVLAGCNRRKREIIQDYLKKCYN